MRGGVCVIMGKTHVLEEDKIKKDLLGQLKINGISGCHYEDLISDYMSFWQIKNALIADIDERGVSVYWCNGGGQEGYKKNDSISELSKTNAQMLKILSELGLKATDNKEVEQDEL